MAHDPVLTAFVIIAALAIVMQAGAMMGIWFALKDLRREAESIRTDMKQRLDPLAQSVTEIVANSREPIRTITANMAEISRLLRDRTGHVDALAADLVDKSRLQIIRVDQLISDVMGKLETTTHEVQRSVLGPLRELAAVIRGVRTGFDFFFSRRRSSSASDVTQDEQMFI